jgi:predicted nucleic acid-binding protein
VSGAVYLDTSALVKLILEEQESEGLGAYLEGATVRVSSALARAELVRVVRASEPRALPDAQALLQELELIALDDELLDRAADVTPNLLRSLDAIHIAAVQTLGGALDALVTYDHRMIDAAQSLEIPVVHPGMPSRN